MADDNFFDQEPKVTEPRPEGYDPTAVPEASEPTEPTELPEPLVPNSPEAKSKIAEIVADLEERAKHLARLAAEAAGIGNALSALKALGHPGVDKHINAAYALAAGLTTADNGVAAALGPVINPPNGGVEGENPPAPATIAGQNP